MVEGGCYLAMEGPQFSTKAESALYRSWGCDVIGMTNMPEAKLAREAELPYAVGRHGHRLRLLARGFAHVEVAHILAVLAANAGKARDLVRRPGRAACRPSARPRRSTPASTAPLITAPAARDPAMVERLAAVAGRALGRTWSDAG